MQPRRFGLSLLLAAFFLAPAAAAQQASGFALDSFHPSDRGSDWFANESLDLRGHLRTAIGVVGDWGYLPLVIYAPDGEPRTNVIEQQVFAHEGISVNLWSRLRLAANLPLLVYQTGSAGRVGNTTYVAKTSSTFGDARLGADVRLAGAYGGPVTVAAGVQAYLPTGRQDTYVGDGKARVGPRLMVAGDVSAFTYAARVGFMYRAQDRPFAGSPMGSEMTFGAAAGARLGDGRLTVGPEISGSTVVSSSKAVFARLTTPVELLLGAHYRAGRAWRVGAGLGPGLTRGLGTPEMRWVVSVEWFPAVHRKKKKVRRVAPPAPPPDADHDGIPDADDACPRQPGVHTNDPKTNGCPVPMDSDHDGIPDGTDACPLQAGVKTDNPQTNGCPPPDRDQDGIPDQKDACPDKPGVKTDDPKTNGCPPPADSDGDGIKDPEDACPKQPGPPNPDPKKNGCPIARIAHGQIKITERIEFETNSAKLKADSDSILQAVASLLKAHPGITRVSVEGHTDDRGSAAYNQRLSLRRARSVVKWLVEHGIDNKRLAAKGFGERQPIDTNDTAEGRRNNRRVEFHVAATSGGPAGDGAAPHGG